MGIRGRDGNGHDMDASALHTPVMLERTLELLADPAELDRLLAANAERAAEVADATLRRAMQAMGLR